MYEYNQLHVDESIALIDSYKLTSFQMKAILSKDFILASELNVPFDLYMAVNDNNYRAKLAKISN